MFSSCTNYFSSEIGGGGGGGKGASEGWVGEPGEERDML